MRRFAFVLLIIIMALPLHAQEQVTPLLSITVTSDDPLLSINGAAWSPGGAHVMAWTSDGVVRVWDAATGDELRRFNVIGRAWWGADDDTVLTYDYTRDEVALRDVETGDTLYTVTNTNPLDLVSPDKALLVTTDVDAAYVYEFASGDLLHTLPDLPFDWFWLGADTAGATQGNEFQRWNLAGGERVNAFVYEGFVSHYNHNRLLTTEQTADVVRLRLYDIERGIGARVYRVNGGVSQARLAGSGDYLYVTARDDLQSGERLIVWNIFAGEATVLNPAADDERRNILAFAASPDETQMLTVSYVLDVETSQPTPGTEQVSVWDVTSGERVQAITLPELTQGRWAPDGAQIIVWGNAGGAVVDVASGEVILRFSEDAFVRNVALSPEGERVLVWGNNRLEIWLMA